MNRRVLHLSPLHWILVLLAVGYLFAAISQIHRPQSASGYNQHSYVELGRKLRNDPFGEMVPRTRMPLYSLLLATFTDTHSSTLQLIHRAKWFTVLSSLLFLFALYLVFRKNFGELLGAVLVLVAAFSLFLFKAPYAQPELLYYFLFFLSFYWMLAAIEAKKFSPSTGVVLGLVSGLSFWTKASNLPALALFVTYMIGKGVWEFTRGKSAEATGRFLSVCVVVAVFATSISPWIVTNVKVFGSPLYNANSSLHLWYDQAWQRKDGGTQAFDDGYHYPNIPAERLPSAGRYWREHSLVEIGERIARGFGEICIDALHGFGYLKYTLILTAICMFLHFRAPKQYQVSQFLFLVPFFAGYLLLYSFYAPISVGNRFILSLYLPFLFVVGRFITAYGKRFEPELASRFLWISLWFVSVDALISIFYWAGHISSRTAAY